jgi:hypothetical protein
MRGIEMAASAMSEKAPATLEAGDILQTRTAGLVVQVRGGGRVFQRANISPQVCTAPLPKPGPKAQQQQQIVPNLWPISHLKQLCEGGRRRRRRRGGGWRWGGRVHTGDVCLYVAGRRFLYYGFEKSKTSPCLSFFQFFFSRYVRSTSR